MRLEKWHSHIIKVQDHRESQFETDAGQIAQRTMLDASYLELSCNRGTLRYTNNKVRISVCVPET